MDRFTQLALVAATHGMDAYVADEMMEAIERGWSGGPAGVLDELAQIGLTLEALMTADETIAGLRAHIDAIQEPVMTKPKRRRKVA